MDLQVFLDFGDEEHFLDDGQVGDVLVLQGRLGEHLLLVLLDDTRIKFFQDPKVSPT